MNISVKLIITAGIIVVFSFKVFCQTKFIDIKSADSSNGDLILAEAGDKKITVREFLYGYELGPAFPKKVKNSKEVYLNYLINEKLLARDGYSRKLDTTSLVKENLYGIETDLMTEEMFKDQILPQIKITDKDINEAVRAKLTSVELKWLFAPDKDSLQYYVNKITSGVTFDSLFNSQLTDSVFADQRSWNTDIFTMEQKSSMIAGLIKNQKAGSISSPVKGSDGWYIFKLVNIWKESLPNESEIIKLKEDSERALEKGVMDSLSDNYVKQLFENLNPQIDGKVFYVLRLYLAKYEIDEKKFNEWNLEASLDSILRSIDILKQDINALVLVNMNQGSYSIKDFIDWLRYREQLVKFNESDFNSFSRSVEAYVWRMVRDNSLTKNAFTKGYQNKKEIREQLGWWKDKIVYALVRDEIINSGEITNSKDSFKYEYKPLSDEANKKLVHKVLALKQKNKININKDLLNQIKVKNENDPKTVEVYAVKKGGIFPHPAFPTIDLMWQNWQ
jgi:hypothetical protein